MSGRTHTYTCALEWTGNTGRGTADYRAYARDHVFTTPGKPDLPGSADATFRGDKSRYNPEELLVAATASCHMLWYLHLCAEAGVVVVAYHDDPVGTMVEDAAHGGYFTKIVLHPKVTIAAGSDRAKARALHGPAHAKCFIANSVNFPVDCAPEIVAGE